MQTEQQRAAQRRYREKHKEVLREKSRVRSREYYAANKTRALATSKRWRDAHPEKMRAYTRKFYGCSEPTRPCPTVCECCGSPPKKKSLHTDHDHKTGKFRGWLCSNCNTGIGLLGDRVFGLIQALSYLNRSF